MSRQKTLANLAKVRETGSTWEFHIPRIDTWGYLAVAGVLLPLLKVICNIRSNLSMVGSSNTLACSRFTLQCVH